jgi:tetratricopeptide (TPR) repeat protein
LPGAERGVDPALAAADAAQASGAYDEATTFLRMALDLLPAGDSRRPRLLGRLGVVQAWALAFDDAVAVAEEAGDAIAESETKQAAAEYLADAAYACASAGGIVASWALARRGLSYAGARGVAWARLVCFDYQRREAEDPDHPGIPMDTGERREAAAILRSAQLDPLGPAPMEAVFDSRQEAAQSSNLIVAVLWAGDHLRVLPRLEAEATEAETQGRLARAARACAMVSQAQAAVGRLAEARASHERGCGLAARLGDPVGAMLYSQYMLCGVFDEGWEQLGATCAGVASSNHPALAWVIGFANAGRVRGAAHLGRTDEAIDVIGLLVPWLERAPAWTIGYPAMACASSEALWLLERVEHISVVEHALREKLLPADFRGIHDPRLELARVCALTGRHEEAEGWFADARRTIDEGGTRPLRAVCDFDQAMMYARRAGAGDAERARPLLDAAWRQFDDIGMTGWIRRAEQLEARLG